jgi:predicted dehydrogenase
MTTTASNPTAGIIGIGPVTGAWMNAFHRSEFPVAGVYDPDLERTGRFCGQFGIPPCDGIGAVLETSPGIMVVASPPDTHLRVVREIVQTAQAWPLVLLVSSPLVDNEADLDEIVAIGRQPGLTIVPMLDLSYGAVGWLKHERGRIGELFDVDASFEVTGAIPDETPSLGSGTLLLPQLLEIVFLLTGWRPFRVAAMAHGVRSGAAEDLLVAQIAVARSDDDRTRPISVTARVGQGADATRLLVSLRGTNGTAVIESRGAGDELTLIPEIRFGPEGRWLTGQEERGAAWPTRADARVRLLRDVLETHAAMTRGEPAPDSLPAGLPRLGEAETGLATVFRCYEAIAGFAGPRTGSA